MKIGTLNVHEFTDSNNIESLDRFIELLAHVNLDVIGLQEVDSENNLRIIISKLSEYQYIYERHCAILSKYPINKISKKSKERYVKGLLTTPSGKQLTIVNVHLNYQLETIRIEEIQNIKKCDKTPVILMGDFNSLTKNDYTDKEWHHIYKIRKYHKWELPVSILTDMISRDFYDTRKLVKAPIGKLETCRFNTRIDYIYVNKYLKDIILKHEHYETMPEITDHNMVISSIKY